MSAASRGYGCALRVFVLLPAPCAGSVSHAKPIWRHSGVLARQIRQFQVSIRCRAAQATRAGKPRIPPKTMPAATPPPPAGPLLRTSTYAEQLAAKGVPTILYEAPSQLWFSLTSLGASVFCIGYTLVQYWSVYLTPPVGLAWWVPHAYGVICMFMVGMGGFFLVGPSGVIRMVRAVPRAVQSTATGSAATAAPRGVPASSRALSRSDSLDARAPAPIQLEIATQRMLAFMPPKRTLVEPSDLLLPFRITSFFSPASRPSRPLMGWELVAQKRAEAERLQRELQYDKEHIMTAPFRHAGRVFTGLWYGLRRSLTREGFAKVEVKGGGKYKLDVTGGWALDNGRALDRLATIKEDKMGRVLRDTR